MEQHGQVRGKPLYVCKHCGVHQIGNGKHEEKVRRF
jgi:hypothetical protein